MPNSPSAKKRLRQSEKNRMRNRAVKSTLRTQGRKVKETLEGTNTEAATVELKSMAKKLDQAASKGIIHKNKAARTKSRLNKRLKLAKGVA